MMKDNPRFLILNVGSTSTKAAYFDGRGIAVEKTLPMDGASLAACKTLPDQLPLRRQGLLRFLEENGIELKSIDLFISRGGLGKPGPAGAYRIDDRMTGDLMGGKYGLHPSAIGPALALALGREFGKNALVVDPPSTDEFEPVARISGIPEIERKSAFHALNQKAAARKVSKQLGKRYEEMNFIVAHLGGGITVGAHRKGKVVDCTHGLGEGPFTPERAGGLPTTDLVDLAGKTDRKDLLRRLVGDGGLAAYLGTKDALDVESRIAGGDEKALKTYEAMAYQAAKDIGAMATVLQGKVDGVILTGGLARSEMLTRWIRDRVSFLAPVYLSPGEDEMKALAEGGLRIWKGEEPLLEYEGT
jgi:butyrate kinase